LSSRSPALTISELPPIAASTRSSRCNSTNTPRGSRSWKPLFCRNNLRLSCTTSQPTPFNSSRRGFPSPVTRRHTPFRLCAKRILCPQLPLRAGCAEVSSWANGKQTCRRRAHQSKNCSIPLRGRPPPDSACIKLNYRGRNIMNRRSVLILTSMALLCVAIALPAGDAVAQQKQKASYKVPAENTKYTQQLNIPVGDVPGH